MSENMSQKIVEGDVATVFDGPETLASLSATSRYDKQLVGMAYMLWGEAIAPYVPYQVLSDGPRVATVSEHPENAPKTLYQDVSTLPTLNPSIVDQISTNDKYSDEFLEKAYPELGVSLEGHIPDEMFFWLDQEAKAREYHEAYEAGYEEFAKVMQKTRQS